MENNNIKQTSLSKGGSNEMEIHTISPEVFKGESSEVFRGTKGPSLNKEEAGGLEGPKGPSLPPSREVYRGTEGPSLSKKEWERISATIYSFANTELNLKRPLK